MRNNLAAIAIAIGAIGATATAQAEDHSVAIVNDARSHGQVGDSFLSLNEVILLNKKAITEAQLSAAERAQLTGAGADIAWADCSNVPRITAERDFDVIANTPHGLIISGALGAVPVIDMAGSAGFLCNSDFADFRNLVIQNCAVAITLNQDDAIYGTTVDNVLFRQIGGTAIKASFTSAGSTTRLQIEGCTFEQVPTALELFDTGLNRRGTVTLQDLAVQGGNNGLLVHLGPGGTLNVLMERLAFTGTRQAIAFERPQPAATRQVTLDALHVTCAAVDTGLSFAGSPGAADRLTLRMCDLQGQTHALRLWPTGTGLQATVEDGRTRGSVALLTGQGAGILAANLRMTGGTLDLGSTGAPVRVTDTILDTVAVRTQGSAAVAIDASRFIGGSLQGTAAAPLAVTGSYVGTATVGASASTSGDLPAPQLGSMDVAPLSQGPGGTVFLQADLPPNLTGIWLVGLAETLPFIGPRPVHLYFWLQFHVALPLPVSGQAQLPLPIPNDPNLLGWDWIAQIAVVPNPGMSAPPLSMPPGRRFVTR